MYVIATVLDPRYKLKFLESNTQVIAKNWIIEDMKNISPVSIDIDENNDNKQLAEQEKSNDKNEDVWSCIDEILCENNSNEEESYNVENSTDKDQIELLNFLKYPNVPRTENPLVWWSKNAGVYPKLSKLARKYLSPPPSSIPSERMFSEAGIIYEERRNKLLPRNAEKLLFLHYNLQLLKFNY